MKVDYFSDKIDRRVFDMKNLTLVKCFQVCKDTIISLRSFASLAFIFSIITFSIIIF